MVKNLVLEADLLARAMEHENGNHPAPSVALLAVLEGITDSDGTIGPPNVGCRRFLTGCRRLLSRKRRGCFACPSCEEKMQKFNDDLSSIQTLFLRCRTPKITELVNITPITEVDEWWLNL